MIRLTPMRLALACCALAWLWLAGGQAVAAGPAVSRWQVVLVAGDNAQPVFDNAVDWLARWLADHGVAPTDIHRLSAHPPDSGVEAASAGAILRRIASLPARPGEGCLVFITSHGKQGAGIHLAYSAEYLRPEPLAQALSMGCGTAPTVVILSACFSGAFTTGAMRAPNRIILSAARPDRPSFGCQADRTYTVFDECLLGVLPRAATWRAVYDQSQGCVREREHQMSVLPSQPQAWFGAAVRDLAVR